MTAGARTPAAISGGGRGIGRAVARAYAQAGHAVSIADTDTDAAAHPGRAVRARISTPGEL